MIGRQTYRIERGDLRRAFIDRPEHRVEHDQGGDQQRHPDATLAAHRVILRRIHHPQPPAEAGEEIVVDAVGETLQLSSSPGQMCRHRRQAGVTTHADDHARRQHYDLTGGQMREGRRLAAPIGACPPFLRLVGVDVERRQRRASHIDVGVEGSRVEQADEAIVLTEVLHLRRAHVGRTQADLGSHLHG